MKYLLTALSVLASAQMIQCSQKQEIPSTHKIVYFVSPPRSLSTAFLRMIQARGDFFIMHEPSMVSCNLLSHSTTVQSWCRPEALQSFCEVKKTILQHAQRQNVFVKKMALAVRAFQLDDFELMQNPNVQFVFLVRNPHHAALSLYKKSMKTFDIMGPRFSEILGYKALYEVFMAAKKHATWKP